MAAITYLKDVTFSIQAAGADNGATTPTTTGDPVTFFVDSVRIRFERNLEDHSAGSQEIEHMRTKKRTQSIDVSKKLDVNDPVSTLLNANELVVFSLAGTTSTTVPEPFKITGAHAIVGNLEAEFGAPSTLSFTLSSYGTAWV